ncbi:MAG: cytochrome c-type biogenesis protein [Rhizomicrobium sp.]
MMRVVLALMLVLFASAVQASPAPDALSNPAQEARARNLQKELRCLVCQGESLDESNASLAIDLRHLIRTRIKAGDSDEQIISFLVARYGDFILMEPPFESSTYALWLTPFGVLILGAGVAIWIVVRARKRSQGEA